MSWSFEKCIIIPQKRLEGGTWRWRAGIRKLHVAGGQAEHRGRTGRKNVETSTGIPLFCL